MKCYLGDVTDDNLRHRKMHEVSTWANRLRLCGLFRPGFDKQLFDCKINEGAQPRRMNRADGQTIEN